MRDIRGSSSFAQPTLTALWTLVGAFLVALNFSHSQAQERGMLVAQESKRRRALVIGNQDYPDAPLLNTRRDALDTAAKLRALGFDVLLRTELSRRETRLAVDEYVAQLRNGDISFFYYAGHGLQLRGENYLLPIDFTAKSEADVEDEAFRVGRLLEKVEEAAPSISVVVLDACRNNPFLRSRGVGSGLVGINATRSGTLIAFATSPGRVAADGPPGRNGVFTASLLKFLDRRGLDIEQMFKLVREDVVRATDQQQIPWSSSSLTGNFSLVAGPELHSPSLPTDQPIPPPSKVATQLPIYRRWWFWSLLAGSSAAALAVGLGVGLTRPAAAEEIVWR